MNIKRITLAIELSLGGVAALAGSAAALCSVAPVPQDQVATCADLNGNFFGLASVGHDQQGQPRIVEVFVNGGDGRPFRANSIGFDAQGDVLGTAEVFETGVVGEASTDADIATHDLLVVGNRNP